ncbi:MAG: hypothetical protein IJL26_05105, partial [Clostridia bacterium]|nr:hypothetical protein [Clostridia bacterium]
MDAPFSICNAEFGIRNYGKALRAFLLLEPDPAAKSKIWGGYPGTLLLASLVIDNAKIYNSKSYGKSSDNPPLCT